MPVVVHESLHPGDERKYRFVLMLAQRFIIRHVQDPTWGALRSKRSSAPKMCDCEFFHGSHVRYLRFTMRWDCGFESSCLTAPSRLSNSMNVFFHFFFRVFQCKRLKHVVMAIYHCIFEGPVLIVIFKYILDKSVPVFIYTPTNLLIVYTILSRTNFGGWDGEH